MTNSSANLDSTSSPPAPGPAGSRSIGPGRVSRWSSCTARASPRRSFDPVVPLLAAKRDVIAVDLPGHGESPRQPKGAGSAPRDLASPSASCSTNSGWRPRTSPGTAAAAGWPWSSPSPAAPGPSPRWRRPGSAKAAPLHIRAGMRQARFNAKVVAGSSRTPRGPGPAGPSPRCRCPATLPGALRARPRHRRRHGVGARFPGDAARPGEGAVHRRRRDHRAGDRRFGTRDRVLLPGVARRRDELPDQTRWVRLRGCGHVPMVDDPDATAALLLRSSDPGTAPGLGEPVR